MRRRILNFFTLVNILLVGSRACICNAVDCNMNLSSPKQIAYTITVDKSGRGNFTSIQSAIDSIPVKNNQWIRIQISSGTYTEKITVPVEKPCLFFQGASRNSTSIEWDDHEDVDTSATVSFFADNILVTGITFKNTYNFNTKPPLPVPWKQAVSARAEGDRIAFYDSAFYGIQDTLFDKRGRHYFKNCYIEGAVDFICGDGQSIYEQCQLYVNIGRYMPEPGLGGWITAQKKEEPQDPGAFVFKFCQVNGVGKTHLGRAWGAYATVIFANTSMSDIIAPEGWDPWKFKGQESKFTFVEANNSGAGSDTSKRVPWMKKLDASQLQQFTDISFINSDGWIQKLPL